MTSFCLLVMPLLMQSSILLAFFGAEAKCSLILILSTRTSRSLSAELLSSWVDPSLCCTLGLCFPRCKTLHLSLLNFIMFLVARSSSLSRSSCRVARPSEVSTSPLSLVSSTNFIRVHLVLSPRSLTKIWNGIGPNINPWATTLVTVCKLENNCLLPPSECSLSTSFPPAAPTTSLDYSLSILTILSNCSFLGTNAARDIWTGKSNTLLL